MFWCRRSTDEIVHKASIRSGRIISLGDRSADNDVIRAHLTRLCRSGNSLLVSDVSVGIAHAGGDGEELLAARSLYCRCLKRRAYDAVKSAVCGILRVCGNGILLKSKVKDKTD